MRAASLKSGTIYVKEDAPDPVPTFGTVLVEVKACGICGSDLHFAKYGAEMLALGKEMGGMPAMGDGSPSSTSTRTCTWATSSAPRCSTSVPTPSARLPARSSRRSRCCSR